MLANVSIHKGMSENMYFLNLKFLDRYAIFKTFSVHFTFLEVLILRKQFFLIKFQRWKSIIRRKKNHKLLACKKKI